MNFNFRINKRNDLDLVTLYLRGIQISEIARIALFHFARGEDCSIVVEPVDPISLENASIKVPSLKTGEMKNQAFKLEVRVHDPLSENVLKSVRSVYGCELIKHLIRRAILNYSFSNLLVTSDFEISEKSNIHMNRTTRNIVNQHGKKAVREYVDLRDYNQTIRKTAQAVRSRELSLYESLMKHPEPDWYIAKANQPVVHIAEVSADVAPVVDIPKKAPRSLPQKPQKPVKKTDEIIPEKGYNTAMEPEPEPTLQNENVLPLFGTPAPVSKESGSGMDFLDSMLDTVVI